MSKTIVITGAGVGLGRALARRFAADGDNVVLLGRTLAKVQSAADEIGERAMAVGCEISDPESVRNAFAAIAEKYPVIDVLINNAAIFQPFRLKDATDDQILGIVGANLTGTLLCCRSAIPMMVRGSHIINVSSESVEIPLPHLTVYQSSKGGVETLTRHLFRELEPDGVRVSCVRAGTMYEEGKTWDADPEAQMAFGKAAMERGMNLREQPIAHVNSVTDVFRSLIDLPPDLHAVMVTLHSRTP